MRNEFKTGELPRQCSYTTAANFLEFIDGLRKPVAVSPPGRLAI